MSELYTKYADQYASAIEDNIYNARYDRPSLLSLLSGQKFENCLDMGCGSGAYFKALSEQCQNIVGLDKSAEFVKMAIDKNPDMRIYQHDLKDPLVEADGVFDLVISPLTVHYIEDLNALFKEVGRILKKGGNFVFSTHHPIVDLKSSVSNDYFEREYLTQNWNTVKDQKTEVSFYRRPLSETLNALFDAGFVIEGFSEGVVSADIKQVSEVTYKKLSTKPIFMFVKAKKC